MKKRSLLVLVVLVLLIPLCFTACEESDAAPNNDESETAKIETSRSMDIPVPDHDHIYELKVLVPPSCGVAGTQAYVCVICGKLQHETSVAALPHNYKRNDTLSAWPTCTTAGKGVYCCSTCGCTQEEVLGAIGHRWRTKITCNSNTNELIITPYCMVCHFVSTSEYKYRVNDAEKLIHQKDQIAEYSGHHSSNGIITGYYLRAPYYAVYCSDTYLLIVRNAEHFLWCSEFTSSDGAIGYYTRLGCTVVYETHISITADGRIQPLQ